MTNLELNEEAKAHAFPAVRSRDIISEGGLTKREFLMAILMAGSAIEYNSDAATITAKTSRLLADAILVEANK